MLRVLRRGEVLGVLMDQDTRVPSVFVPFFGKSASTPKGGATLSRLTGAQVVVGTIHRTANAVHVIDVVKCELPRDERDATALLTAVLEKRVRRHPADWLWFHERWKTRPSHEVAA
jgi:KDO2-lipid IV(A) lauroyltransferase